MYQTSSDSHCYRCKRHCIGSLLSYKSPPIHAPSNVVIGSKLLCRSTARPSKCLCPIFVSPRILICPSNICLSHPVQVMTVQVKPNIKVVLIPIN